MDNPTIWDWFAAHTQSEIEAAHRGLDFNAFDRAEMPKALSCPALMDQFQPVTPDDGDKALACGKATLLDHVATGFWNMPER